MKKEKHPIYWLIVIVLTLLLALGVLLLIRGLQIGPDALFLTQPMPA